jgi:predicted amidohydrolase
MIVDPWGRILAEAGTEPGVIMAEIDPALSLTIRGRIPALANERAFTAPAAAAGDELPTRKTG